jgi:protein phosphatase
VKLDYYAISNCGPYRNINQDCFCCNNVLYANTKRISLQNRKFLEIDKEISVFAVADGMGGHEAGEEASKFAIERFCEKVKYENFINENPINLIYSIIQKVNQELFQHALLVRHPDMGTTLTGILLFNKKIYSFHVGDTHLYVFANNKIQLLTQDHSLAYEKKNTIYKHLLTSCIGGGSEKIKIDVADITDYIQENSYILLTSDGLHEVLEEKFLEDLIQETKDPVKICKIAIQEGLFRESQDNLTILAIKFIML